MTDGSVTLAAVAGAHGVTGEVRLKLFTDVDGLRLHKTFDANGRTLTLKSVRPGPQGAIARFAEVEDRTAAEALRGALLTVPRSSLPPLGEGEYYWHDLIGLPVMRDDGVPAGTVATVENFGASDVLEIERPDGSCFMVPMTPAVVLEVGERIIIVADYDER